MSQPQRFFARRGQKLLPGQKLVGRNTRWGNPFAVAGKIDPRKPPRLVRHYADKWETTAAALVCGTDELAVRRYREALVGGKLDYGIPEVRENLAGFDLGCPCGLEHCHANVLLELANR